MCPAIFIRSWMSGSQIWSILDIMLPDEDGLEIVGKLRRRPETKKTR